MASEAFASLFTGDELDYAVASALGGKYRGNLSPGCKLIGEARDRYTDLDDLVYEGAYTIIYYINGPADFMSTDENPDPGWDDSSAGDDQIPYRLKVTSFSVRPIYLHIYAVGGDSLYQTMIVGTKLFFRDMWSMENAIEYQTSQGTKIHIPWRSIDLGAEQSVVRSFLGYDASGNDQVLSQRMGTALVDFIKRLSIGNANLLDFTNGFFLYSADHASADISHYWNMSAGVGGTPSIETVTYDDISTSNVDNINGDLALAEMPLFDDIDNDIVTLFRSTGNCSFANYGASSNATQIINKIAVGANAKYTASVYLIYDEGFVHQPDAAKAFIKIGYASGGSITEVATSEVQLNLLGGPNDYDQVPENAIYKNYIYDGTEYADVAYNYGDFTNVNKAASEMGYYRLSVTLSQDMIDDSSLSSLVIVFGVTGTEDVTVSSVTYNGGGIFTLPKVEYGDFATQYNHSWGDLYYYFTNTEAIYGVPIIKPGRTVFLPKDFEDQDSIVYKTTEPVCGDCGSTFIMYDGETGEPEFCYDCGSTNILTKYFNVEPVAVGGGGGFVQHTIDDLTIRNENDQTLKYGTTTISPSIYIDGKEKTEGRNKADKIVESYRPDGKNLVHTHGGSDAYNQHYYNEGAIKQMYPRYKDILFLNRQTGELICWDDLVTVDISSDGSGTYRQTGGFVSLSKPYVIRESNNNYPNAGPKPIKYLHETEPLDPSVDPSTTPDRSYVEDFVGTNKFWLQKDPGTSEAVLKYYDPDEEAWKAPRTEPTAIYVVQPNAPSSDWEGKLWINSTTGVMYYSVRENNSVIWKPVYAAWGANPANS